MKIRTKAEILSALNTNAAAKAAQQATLEAEINKWNECVRKNEIPTNAEQISTELKALRPYTQWVECLEILKTALENLKVNELTEEQIKVALVKARRYPDITTKTDTGTMIMSLVNRQTRFDISGMLKKLEVEAGWKYDITLLAVTTTYSIARDLGLTVENLVECAKMKEAHRQRMGDEKVAEKLKAGAKLDSTRQIEKAYQDVLNAFLPGLEYKSTKADSTWFMLGATTLDRKEIGKLKIATGKKFEELVFDSLSCKLRGSSYSVSYKTKEEPKPEETAEKSVAPAEKPEEKAEPALKQEKPKRERQPKPEKAAAKQSKEPAAKTGKGGRGKSKTEAAA